MPRNADPDETAAPRAADMVEVLGFVPLIEAYFRRSNVRMPAGIAAAFDAHGLTARHGAVLGQLVTEEPIGVSELAARMTVSLSTASELVSDLSRAGLVERQEDPANRRRTLVRLADDHREGVHQLVAGRAEPLLRVLDGLPARDRQGFARGLRAWAAEVRSW